LFLPLGFAKNSQIFDTIILEVLSLLFFATKRKDCSKRYKSILLCEIRIFFSRVGAHMPKFAHNGIKTCYTLCGA
jgi:hypothetical protein